jgi:hypothetical protein
MEDMAITELVVAVVELVELVMAVHQEAILDQV